MYHLLLGHLVGNAHDVVLGDGGRYIWGLKLAWVRCAWAHRVAAAASLDTNAATWCSEALAGCGERHKRSVSRLDNIACSSLQNFFVRNVVSGEGGGHDGGEMLECPLVASHGNDSWLAEIGSGNVRLAAGDKILNVCPHNLTVAALLGALAAGLRDWGGTALAFPEVAERPGSDGVVVLGPRGVHLVSLIFSSNHERFVETGAFNFLS